MLSIFSIPKAFKGHTGMIQKNALRSWSMLRPRCQIILFGDDEGAAEAATEFHAVHIPDIQKNEFGTPLLNDAFRRSHEYAVHPELCYVNSDIILLSDFTEAVRKVRTHFSFHNSFLIVGRRWGIDLNMEWNFNETGWEGRLKDFVSKGGTLAKPHAIDFFVFNRGSYVEIPPFAVGRVGWDNWMIYHALACRIPVVDVTEHAQVVHQNHDYSHLQGGDRAFREGPEAALNYKLMNIPKYLFNTLNARWVLKKNGKLKRVFSREHLRSRRHAFFIFHPHIYSCLKPFRSLRRLL